MATNVNTRGGRTENRSASRARLVALVVSTLTCIALGLLQTTQPDWAAGITFWPPWIWMFPGLLLIAMGASRNRKRFVVAATSIWLLYAFLFVDETKGLIRFHRWAMPNREPLKRDGNRFRIISLNCAGGSVDAVLEVVRFRPDLVLLQESPGRRDVEKLAKRLFGARAGFLSGPDASIIADGSVTPSGDGGSFNPFVRAHVRLKSKAEVEVVSLRLMPPVFRTDFWSPSYWSGHADSRRNRRKQMKLVAAQLRSLPHNIPIIVGGDFNAPAGDAIFRLLQPRLHDAFRQSGVGWGNSVLNDIPVSRFDQIWISEGLEAITVVTQRTINSDHRMVNCDVRILQQS